MSSPRGIAKALLACLIAAVALAQGASPAHAASARVYVAPGGSDAGPGSARRPFASLPRALAALPRGGTVLVARGRYPALDDRTVRPARVTVQARNPRRRPRIGGLTLLGATRLRFRHVRIAGPVMISDDVFHRRGSAHIALVSSEVTAPGRNCVIVRSASRWITLRRLHVHHCTTGVGGPAGAPMSRHVRLLDSRLHSFTGDAVQFGRWSDVAIERNRITDAYDPNHVIHNDAIQFTGDSRHVRIVGNELARSGGQLLFIQDAFGPIDDVLVRGNRIHDSAAYAIQSQGATRVRFLDNIVWRSRWGGLLLRQGLQTLPGGGHRRPRDTVVVRNILSGLETDPHVRIARNRGNVIRCGFPGAWRRCGRRGGSVPIRDRTD